MRLKGISIRFRLMLLMICMTTIPVITITWQATENSRNSVEKEILDANKSRLQWASQYLEELIQQLDTLFYSLHINKELINGLSSMDTLAESERYQQQNKMFRMLNIAFYSFSRKIDQLTLYIHTNGKAYTVSYASSGLAHSLDIEYGPWSRMLGTPVGIYFKASGNALNAYHSMNEFKGQSLIGGIAVRINDKVWEQAATILQSEPESAIFLINDEGETLPGSSPLFTSEQLAAALAELREEPMSVMLTKMHDYYLFSKRVSGGKLFLVKAIPAATINESAQKMIMAGLRTGAIFTAISILLSIIVSLRISNPIVSLARTMRKSHIHDFEMKAVHNRDEIGLLEAGYNFMMARIKTFIENEFQHEIEVKKAQLIALQAQINPHFLNNTLHLIGGMALKKGAPEIYRITQVIGDLLRYSISMEGDQTVSLSEELKHTANYLFIQEQRFAGRCEVIMSSNERANEAQMPKFTLQPIVENAFEHGLQQKEGKWRLEVRVRLIRDRLILVVMDNGIGMDADRLAEQRTKLRDGSGRQQEPEDRMLSGRRGIGLSNVHARLTLRYGKRYGVRLFSRSGVGTLVVMTMPLKAAHVMRERSS